MTKLKILMGVTGSVAAIKIPELVKLLHDRGCELQVILTSHAKSFLTEADMTSIHSLGITAYNDESEWLTWNKKGDPVLHIDLRKWCDVFIICPLDANTLAKLSVGMCDNLLTCVARAWTNDKPLIVCPAMNTAMWDNPFTGKQLQILRDVYAAQVVPPKEDYVLACGDVGPGAMADVRTIADAIMESI